MGTSSRPQPANPGFQCSNPVTGAHSSCDGSLLERLADGLHDLARSVSDIDPGETEHLPTVCGSHTVTFAIGVEGIVIAAEKFSRKVNLTEAERTRNLQEIKNAEIEFLGQYREATKRLLNDAKKALAGSAATLRATRHPPPRRRLLRRRRGTATVALPLISAELCGASAGALP